MSAHAPGEIRISGDADAETVYIEAPENKGWSQVTGGIRETAHRRAIHEELVRRWNAHGELVAALEALCPDDPPALMGSTESTRVVCLVGEIRRARAAIAKAGGKPDVDSLIQAHWSTKAVKP